MPPTSYTPPKVTDLKTATYTAVSPQPAPAVTGVQSYKAPYAFTPPTVQQIQALPAGSLTNVMPLKTGENVSVNDYMTLTPPQQTYLTQYGVDKFNEKLQLDTAKFQQAMVVQQMGYKGIVESKFPDAQKDLYIKEYYPGAPLLHSKLEYSQALEAATVGTSEQWLDPEFKKGGKLPVWFEEHREILVASEPHFIRGMAELVVPGYYQSQHWGEMSWTERIGYSVLDLVTVGLAAKGLVSGLVKIGGPTKTTLRTATKAINDVRITHARLDTTIARLSVARKTGIEALQKVKGVVGTIARKQEAQLLSDVVQAANKAKVADKNFVKLLETLETISSSQLKKVEKATKMTGLKNAVLNINKTQQQLTAKWKYLEKWMKEYGYTPAQFSKKAEVIYGKAYEYTRQLTRIQALQDKLDLQLLKYNEVVNRVNLPKSGKVSTVLNVQKFNRAKDTLRTAQNNLLKSKPFTSASEKALQKVRQAEIKLQRAMAELGAAHRGTKVSEALLDKLDDTKLTFKTEESALRNLQHDFRTGQAAVDKITDPAERIMAESKLERQAELLVSQQKRVEDANKALNKVLGEAGEDVGHTYRMNWDEGLPSPDELNIEKLFEQATEEQIKRKDYLKWKETQERPWEAAPSTTKTKTKVEPSATTTKTKPKGIPTQITRDMETRLKSLGYTNAQINRLKPEEAWRILEKSTTQTSILSLTSQKTVPTIEVQQIKLPSTKGKFNLPSLSIMPSGKLAIMPLVVPITKVADIVQMTPANIKQATPDEIIQFHAIQAIETSIGKPITELETQTEMQTADQINTQYMQELGNKLKIITATYVDILNKTDNEDEAKDQAFEKAKEETETKTQTKVEIATKTDVITETEVNKTIRDIFRGGKGRKFLFIPLLFPSLSSDSGRKRYSRGSVAWKQGLFYKIAIPVPGTRRLEVLTTRERPQGVRIVKGPDSAFKSMGKKGYFPVKATYDMGIMDVQILKSGRKLKFVRDPKRRTKTNNIEGEATQTR